MVYRRSSMSRHTRARPAAQVPWTLAEPRHNDGGGRATAASGSGPTLRRGQFGAGLTPRVRGIR
jgi:hypothetical protein